MFKQFFKNNPELAEKNFFDHIEKLRWHVLRALAVVLIVSIVVFIKINFFYDHILMAPTKHTFITFRISCHIGHLLGLGDKLCIGDLPIMFQNKVLSGQFIQAFTSSFIFGIIIAAPYVLWEFWSFIKPAFKPGDLKYTRGIVFWSTLLFFMGVAFGYFIVAPYTVVFFATYSISSSIHNIITIKSYLSTLRQVILGTGGIFELPILTFFLAKAGIISTSFIKRYQRHAIVVIVILAAVIGPPNVASQFILSIPLFSLYILSVQICKRVERQRMKEERERGAA